MRTPEKSLSIGLSVTTALIISMLLGTGASGAGNAEDSRGIGVEGQDFAVFRASQLECTIGNNKSHGEHRAGYNGIHALASADSARNPFVLLYAGVNLEHYFDTGPRRSDQTVMFEPRFAPMVFTRISDRVGELHQPATPVFRVESWTRFELKDPCYVDVSFKCRLHGAVFPDGVMGVFWASYINAPLNKSIYFLGPGASLGKPYWQQLCAQVHAHDSTVRRQDDSTDIQFKAGPPTLFNQFSPLRFGQPFFYGVVEDHVLLYIFEDSPYLRFAQSPDGGSYTTDKTDSNPAWDFQLVVPNAKVDAEYGLRMRLVYKRWIGREDILTEVRRYRALQSN